MFVISGCQGLLIDLVVACWLYVFLCLFVRVVPGVQRLPLVLVARVLGASEILGWASCSLGLAFEVARLLGFGHFAWQLAGKGTDSSLLALLLPAVLAGYWADRKPAGNNHIEEDSHLEGKSQVKEAAEE